MLSLAVTAVFGPGGVAHGAQDGAGEAGAVLHRAAELVVAPVELGAQERAQEVVVADVHLDAVEAGLHGERGGAPVVLGDALDAGDVDGAQARAHGGEAARGRERGGAVGAGVGDRPGVADLRRRRGALGVDGVGEAAQARDGVLVRGAGSGGRCAPRATRPGRPRWTWRRRRRPRGGGTSTSSSLTVPPGITPSKVAALMMRLRSVSGPSGAGAKTACGAAVRAVRGMGLPLPTAGTGRTSASGPGRSAGAPAGDGAGRSGGPLTPQDQSAALLDRGRACGRGCGWSGRPGRRRRRRRRRR